MRRQSRVEHSWRLPGNDSLLNRTRAAVYHVQVAVEGHDDQVQRGGLAGRRQLGQQHRRHDAPARLEREIDLRG